ncbi:MAG: hypothetical protein MMC33_003880 [Icmadophila ericetorum]|nr:hypothetical protein [Icmadophila ericetorum]
MQALRRREIITIDDSDSEHEDALDPDNALLMNQIFDLEREDEQHFFDGLLDRLPHPVDPVNLEVLPEETNTPVIETDPAVLYQAYLSKVLEVFPDICLNHAQQLYDDRTQAVAEPGPVAPADNISQIIVLQILESGKYPKERETRKALKRKRESEEEEGEDPEWTSPRRLEPSHSYREEVRSILSKEFINIPVAYINSTLREKKFLYATYLELEATDRTYRDKSNPPYRLLKNMRKTRANPKTNGSRFGMTEIERELQAVRKRRERQDGNSEYPDSPHSSQSSNCLKAQRRKIQEEADADLALEQEAQERGDMIECQCCFSDVPTAKSTHCCGETPHFFCLECARGHAKSQAELSRHQLTCMDGSGCKAEFSRTEKSRFLDKQMFELFERLEQQAALRNANVEGLEKCPFCDFAAIYPPVEVNKEFRCEAPECGRISCRLCKQDSHIPLTCEQYKKEQGVDERHVLEEAMTDALLRKCPRCKIPILKDGGCNKLICSQCKCYVCDYCGKDISSEGYSHFRNIPGDTGCPPNDDTETRNANRVKEAEKQAMAKVRAENPGLSEEDLKIKFSKEVLATERTAATGAHGAHGFLAGVGLGLGLENIGLPIPHNVNHAAIQAHIGVLRIGRDGRVGAPNFGHPTQMNRLPAAPAPIDRPALDVDNQRRAAFEANVQRHVHERRRAHEAQQEEWQNELLRHQEQQRQRQREHEAALLAPAFHQPPGMHHPFLPNGFDIPTAPAIQPAWGYPVPMPQLRPEGRLRRDSPRPDHRQPVDYMGNGLLHYEPPPDLNLMLDHDVGMRQPRGATVHRRERREEQRWR